MLGVGETLHTLKTDLTERGHHDDGEDEHTERFQTESIMLVSGLRM